MTEPRCENCRWWHLDDDSREIGTCINFASSRFFDWTIDDDACQHHEKMVSLGAEVAK